VVFLALYHVNNPTQTQNHQNSNSNKFIFPPPVGLIAAILHLFLQARIINAAHNPA
jgi:hypothetical protein